MKYRIKMGDHTNDQFIIVKDVEAKSVFDAIDMVADTLDNPDEVELIEAVPMIETNVK